ncbi:MAG TPA: nucleotide disphospho-sugar-binding domain-containing protein [Xanthobacteraceae bacterium]|jgi:UDP:flavonoid glycosyltransferase YjiC (YdhE family)
MRATHERRVFFFLSAGWGPAVRTLPIIERLAGHDIASAFALGEAPGAAIRAAGLEPIELRLPPADAAASRTRDWWSPYHHLAFSAGDIAPLLDRVEAYRKAICDGRPAAVVTDINPLAALAARSLQVPHVTISQSLFLPGRKRDAARWAMPSALSTINKVLAYYRVGLLEAAAQLELGDITLIPSLPEFDPLDDTPPSLEYVGPILGNQLVPLRSSAQRPSAAKGAAEIFFYPGRPRDTAGPSGQELLDIVLMALNGTDAAVTVATGGFDFEIPGWAQGRFRIVDWCVISPEYQPDLIIHHGGHGACLTAISAGIPSVVIPTHAEREYNAGNLAALGCGELVAIGEADAARVRRVVEGMLDNAACARRCAQWSETIAARGYGGADLAARMIARILQGG